MACELTIVTLSRNIKYFQRLLKALAQQEGEVPQYLGVLVNNDRDPEKVSLALKADWATLDPRFNTSFSVGNNTAVKAAPDTEWILFLNDDAIPEPLFLDRLWWYRNQADVIGALLLHEDGTVNHAGTRIVLPYRCDHIGRNEPRDRYRGQGFVYTPSVTFAAAMVRADVFNEVGGFDEGYNYGFEDTDLCLKILERGGSVGCARDAVAIHGEGGTRSLCGKQDHHNGEYFIQRWEKKLPDLLREYRRKMNGVDIRVEGA